MVPLDEAVAKLGAQWNSFCDMDSQSSFVMRLTKNDYRNLQVKNNRVGMGNGNIDGSKNIQHNLDKGNKGSRSSADHAKIGRTYTFHEPDHWV